MGGFQGIYVLRVRRRREEVGEDVATVKGFLLLRHHLERELLTKLQIYS